jgi:hypothetical protein
MSFVAAAVPATVRPDDEAQVLADAENVLVSILFDDIVRALMRPPTALVPQPAPAATPKRERMRQTPVTTGRRRVGAAWARSPPRD